MEEVVVQGEGITLELLLHRRYGVRGRDLVTESLSANPGLGSLGAVLPIGTAVRLPPLPAQTVEVAPVVSLFEMV